MISKGISNLHELVCSRLYITGYERQISHIKRCGELILMNDQFKERFTSDSEKALKEVSLDIDPVDARAIFLDNLKTIDDSSLSTAGRLYRKFCQDSRTYVPQTRSWHSRNQILDNWRQKQIARCNIELGKVGRKLAHLPLAFELSTGCSVGCWFCGLGSDKLSGVFRYTNVNAILWKKCLHCMHMFLGEDVEAPICYYATEPLDNQDLLLFLKDCFYEFKGVPQLTTAVATRDFERSKFILQELRKWQPTLHRFSISSINEFQKIMEMFSPEELIDVILMPRFLECTKNKIVGTGKAYGKISRTLPEGTIACVSGFVVNMESKTVRLVTPTCACAKYPNGEIIVGIREFNDADDLEEKVNELLCTLRDSRLVLC